MKVVLRFGAGEKKKAWLAPVFVKCSEIHGDRAISWQPPSHSVSRRRPWARARPGASIRKLQMATCAILINELVTWWCRFQETPAGKILYNKLRPSNWKITDSTVSFSGSFGKESLYFKKKHKSKYLNKKYERNVFIISPSLIGNIPSLLYWILSLIALAPG